VKVFSWANTDLVFEELCSSQFQTYDKIIVKHHSDWFTNKRSYIKEFLMICSLIKKAISVKKTEPILLFGTNLCRLLYPFYYFRSNVFYIYNELPCLDHCKPLFFYDRLIFKSKFDRVILSSQERLTLCKTIYKVGLSLILVNMPCIREDNQDVVKFNKLIYAGLVNHSRFDGNALKLLNSLNIQFDIIGNVIEPSILDAITGGDYIGELSTYESQSLQKKYRYALLSYSTSDVNNNYCAPIKIYEYVHSGCICVSVNKNKGLVRFLDLYPSLFVMLSELNDYQFSESRYNYERKLFLKTELNSLTDNFKIICSKINSNEIK